MKLIDKISATKISDISHEDLKYWLIEELNDMADDFDQTLSDEQLAHIPRRMVGILTDKFRNWEPGKIHSVFQKGITGAYGKSTKITVSLILNWITAEDRLARGENVNRFYTEIEGEKSAEYYRQVGDRCMPFIQYCHKNCIDVSSLSQSDYFELRDRFNDGGEWAVRDELDALPRYKNMEVATKFKF
jgi:hypothetical protein